MFEHVKCIDLTHVLSEEAPTWNGSCGFFLEKKQDYDQIFRVQQIKMHAGVGTHMDAPCHCILEGNAIADIPLESFIVPACVIDVSLRAHADYVVSEQDIEEYELAFGKIPKNALVIAYTGWSRFWPDSIAYRNPDAQGKMHFPAVSKKAAEMLIQRDAAGLAIDTLSPDCSDPTYPVHHLLLGAGKYIIENIADCSHMPPKGGHVVALPLRISEAAEAPMRIIGLIPK
jgi:kynurenine formamidase